MYFCIFEGDNVDGLQPLVYFRPVYDLGCGTKSLLKLFEEFLPKGNLLLHMRSELEDFFYEDYKKNKFPEDDAIIFINGGLIANKGIKTLIKEIKMLEEDTCYSHGKYPVIARVSAENLKKIKKDNILTLKSFYALTVLELPEQLKENLNLIEYPWDLVLNNQVQIKDQLKRGKRIFKRKTRLPRTIKKISSKKRNIYLGKKVKIAKNVLLDACEGPIYIGDGTKILPGAVIMGPVYIGDNSLIKAGAKIYPGVTIGNYCKVGGEVECSIISDYSNKQHEGFLGHSYLGSWVNLGAGTENSDLKNNYSSIKVKVGKKTFDSQKQFLGTMIGDHTKTGIKTMLNSGSILGPFCNIFGSGFQQKYIPPFSWGDSNVKLEDHKIKKAIETAEIVLERRGINLDSDLKKLYKKVYTETSKERK
jgi:UDP-N-acetylglucosamine diphosphorylase/glucosamine-1-phosphate N-acetyltransferase